MCLYTRVQIYIYIYIRFIKIVKKRVSVCFDFCELLFCVHRVKQVGQSRLHLTIEHHQRLSAACHVLNSVEFHLLKFLELKISSWKNVQSAGCVEIQSEIK